METNLKTFAAAVKQACEQTPAAGRFGSKVWIHAAWAIGGFEATLDEFKALLLEAHRAGLVVLSRCDLVEACDPYDVRRSRIAAGVEFNFIRI